jgi:tetratricopeptide (TPR) repeat protein
MMDHGFRRAARVAILVAGGCLVVFLGFLVFRLLHAAPSKLTAQRLTVAQVISGSASAAAALTAAGLALAQARTRAARLPELLGPKLLKEDQLINRSAEMSGLVERMRTSRVIGCHGPRGAGKSFLLEHLTDLVNGHRPSAAGQRRPKRVSVALYFDLADAAGFAEMESQICRAALGDAQGTWSDFVTSVKRRFKHRRVVLVLDNVNSPGLWRQLGGAAYQYCASRPNDTLVLGSIDPVVLSNLDVERIPVPGLDLGATKELVAMRGVDMSGDELVTLHRDSKGLPLYVRLLTAPTEDPHAGLGMSMIDQELIPELPGEARRLLSYVALLALVERRISVVELKRCPIAHVEEQLMIVGNRTLITPIPEYRERRFKIHDVVRDTALRVLDPEVSEAAHFLFERAYDDEQLEHAALYAMFADPYSIGSSRLDRLLAQVIRAAIGARNYALLGTLHSRASERPRILRYMSADRARVDLMAYARASELAGLGRYGEAEEELLSSSVTTTRWQRDREATDLQADLRFLQADVAHLLNRYDEAAGMFEELGQWAAAARRPGLRARCVWGHAHVLRHQGRDLARALELFRHAIALADTTGELFSKAYSITGATGIKVFLEAVPESEERVLTDLEQELAIASTHDGYMLEVWKSQAQVAWLRGRTQDAFEIVEAAIQRALVLNDRLLYNLYFERAEYARLTGQLAAAHADYRRVLDFGSGNRDRNLVANALLALVLVELSAGQWLEHGTRNVARASALRARDIATQADIQITVANAEAAAAMLDETMPAPDSIRLILM